MFASRRLLSLENCIEFARPDLARAAMGCGGHVEHDDALSSLLSEFARTVITDFPITAILEHLVQRIVEVLPITSAGVTLMSVGSAPQYVAASDAAAWRFEQLQSDLASGPCVTSFLTGEAVVIPDLRDDERFPTFAPLAIESGLAAVFTFPLRHGAACIGALDLYRQTPGPFGPRDIATAQTLADVAAAYVLNAQSREDARAAARELHHATLHDSLTGLPNRLLLTERLEQAARRARRSRGCTGVLFIDIDDFKQVNDAHGHHMGDALLVAIAQRLAVVVRSNDTFARFSGDEFVLLCEDLTAVADAEQLAKRIAGCLDEPFAIDDHEFLVTASVGIAVAGPGEEVNDQLIVTADQAMYQIKRKGGSGQQLIDAHEARLMSVDVRLRADLRLAYANRAFVLAYQPIVRLIDGVPIGAEALLRWNHPARGAIPAITTVRLAEQTGLIVDVGLWVLERACIDRAAWIDDGEAGPLHVSVNVSVRQLLDARFASQVDEVLTRTGTDPTLVVLEVTESILIENYLRCASVLTRLKGLGVRLALDDFGTGYSALSYLDRLPIDILKIDRSFVESLEATAASRTIAGSIRRLASDLGLSVVAEGVETQGQHDAVAALECQHAQGYYYGRPTSTDVIDDYFRQHKDRSATVSHRAALR
jgi:diguanylate cyclase (GGDEF)-like protein